MNQAAPARQSSHQRRAIRRWCGGFVRAATDLLLPPACNFCGEAIPGSGEQPLLCSACCEGFQNRPAHVCHRCAAPVQEFEVGSDCPRCGPRRFAFQGAISLGIYRDRLREAVIRMKQRIAEPLAMSMGYFLCDRLGEQILADRPDILIPISTHWTKRLRRGVNSPDLIVEAIAAKLALTYSTRVLFSCRRTRKQGTLLPSERRRNVRSAFGVKRGSDLAGQHVLLVDDIMTTGATAHEAARTLRRAGASRISVLVVARAVGQDQKGLPSS